MAAGLDHLKNDYRRRFCRPSRAPDINTDQSQNMLEILENCFEEKSFIDDFITSSTKSVLYSTSKIKNSGFQSPSKDCQKSYPKSFPVSSRKKETSQQDLVEPSEGTSRSVHVYGIHQAADICSKSTPDLEKKSGRKINNLCAEADEEFYILVGSPTVLLHEKPSETQNAISSAQKRETYTFGNSLNMLSSDTEISVKTKKRLNFEDEDILRNVERDTNKSEIVTKISGQEEKRLSETSSKRVQDTEYEIQSQAKKSFSTLFLETIMRKNESSPIIRHTAMTPSHSSPSNKKLLEDEFIIDESNRSFTYQPWITIPKKGRPLNHHTISCAESTVILQDKKAGECQSISPVTLTNDKYLCKTHPEEKSELSSKHKPNKSCIVIDELKNNHRSIKVQSEKAKSSPRKKRKNRGTKQEQEKTLKTSVVEEQPATGQSEDEHMSDIAHDTLPRNSDRTVEGCEKIRNDHNAKKEMPPLENIKRKCRAKKDKQSKRKHFSSESKREKLVPEEETVTVTRSHRISRRPSDWWVVHSEESSVCSNSLRNDVSVYHNSRQESAKTANQSSNNIVKKTSPSKRQKTSTQRSSIVQNSSNVKSSGGIIDREEVSSCPQKELLESDKTELTKKSSHDYFRKTGHLEHQGGIMSTQNVHLKSETSEGTYKIPIESNLDSGDSKTSVLEESGPSRLKNYLMSGQNNSDVNNEAQESLDNSRVKGSKVAPRNNVHYKLVLPSRTPGVRRTKRIRSKPLEYWRGERVDYKAAASGGFVIDGILSPEIVTSKRKAKEKVKIDTRKRICLDNIERKSRLVVNCDISLGDPFQPTQVKDPETREIIPMDLIRPRDTYQFFVEHGELKVYKTLDTPFFSTGKLILGPYGEKGKQYVGEDILVFYVNVGDLLCTLHETPYIITTGDSFYIPSGNCYNIKNLQNEESILLFTQIKR